MKIINLNKTRKNIFEASTGHKLETLLNTLQKTDTLQSAYTLDNTVNNKELNYQGLQVYRCLVYEQVFESKRKQTNLYKSPYHYHLQKDGFIKIENLYTPSELQNIHKLIENIPTNILQRNRCENLPLTINIATNEKLQNIFKLCQADPLFIKNSLYFRKITHSEPSEVTEDSRQYNFHIDKFYPNFKVWYFPYEVKETSGPLAIFKGSHQCTVEKMKWTHNNTINNKNFSRLHWNVHDYEQHLGELGMTNESQVMFSVPQNTFVITDNRAFHRRTPATPGTQRLAFRAILDRSNILL